jgi:hypothetical protein
MTASSVLARGTGRTCGANPGQQTGSASWTIQLSAPRDAAAPAVFWLHTVTFEQGCHVCSATANSWKM